MFKKERCSPRCAIRMFLYKICIFLISAHYFRLACSSVSLAGNYSLYLSRFSQTSLHVNERNANKCEWADGTRKIVAVRIRSGSARESRLLGQSNKRIRSCQSTFSVTWTHVASCTNSLRQIVGRLEKKLLSNSRQ